MNQNIFGTDGIRCSVGSSPLSLEKLPHLGHAIGSWARSNYGPHPTVLLAHDTRISSSFIKASLTSGLLLSPIALYDAQIMPTPGVCKIIAHDSQFDFGIIISASHNSYQDNGIKLVDAKSGKLDERDEQSISTLFSKKREHHSYANFGTAHTWLDAPKKYIQHVLTYFKPKMLDGLTVVLDCAHGATYQVAPELFKALGARTIVLHNRPTGTNINKECGSLFPKTLQHTVLEHNADVGFAFDGDGDRVIIVNKDGEIKNGDDALALLMNHPNYKNQTQIVGTIMSNQGLAAFLQNQGKQLIRTHVGDKYVCKVLEQKKWLLGGEQSGHIIMRDYLETGDGIFTALRALETMIHTQNWELKTFKKYPQLLINIPVSIKKNLTEPTLATIINSYKAKLMNGRLEVRYSGTENMLRIMIEDINQTTTQAIGQQLSQELKKELSHT